MPHPSPNAAIIRTDVPDPAIQPHGPDVQQRFARCPTVALPTRTIRDNPFPLPNLPVPARPPKHADPVCVCLYCSASEPLADSDFRMASPNHFCSSRCTNLMIPLSLCPEADVIVDPHPMTGAFNMAMDSTLLDLAAHRNRSVLRIYRWHEPTVTLGYFQAASLSEDIPFPGLPVVRRLSGGGAILHHQELTYSCVLPDSHPVRDDPSTLYSIIHQALIQLLTECGAPATLRSEHSANRSDANLQNAFAHTAGMSPPSPAAIVAEPFLCFLRSNPNDIVHCSGPKITGSAQRRRRGAILQHGSILLQASPHAPHIPGLLDLNPDFLLNDFTRLLPSRVAQAVSSNWSLRNYSEQELHLTSQSMQASASL